MNIVKRLCRLAAVVAILSLAAGPARFGDRVHEICVEAGDISYCAPRNP